MYHYRGEGEMIGAGTRGGNTFARAQMHRRLGGQKGQMPDGVQVPCFERQYRHVGVVNWLQSIDHHSSGEVYG